jgi:L-lactate dehydrogenase (cytochrome)
MSVDQALTIADLKDRARRRVPKMFFEYADSGAWTEGTYRANEDDFHKIKLRQRVLVDMTNRSLESEMIGEKVSMPVALAPTGFTGMQHADGEMLAAQAAEEFGVPFTLSTMSICSIEDVRSVTSKPFWFQLYVMQDKDFVHNLIDRAKAAGCSALVLTLDLQILGQRHKDLRNGLSAPPRFTPKHLWQMATRPFWCLDMLGTAPHLRQHCRPRQGGGRPFVALLLDLGTVRSAAVLEGYRVDPRSLGRQAHPQGHSGRGRCAHVA